MAPPKQRRALFLDRDGIFNEVVFRGTSMHSPVGWEEIRHYSLEGLEEAKTLGYLLLMVTNQPDVERGIISESFLKEVHDYYQKKYGLDGVYVCPFSSNEHPNKKPNPGMLLEAAHDWNLDLSQCFFLGDTDKDMEAARRAGCVGVLWDRPYNQSVKSNHRISSIKELITLLKTSY